MTNFADLIPDPVMVKTGKGEFPVNGIPIQELARLIKDHSDELTVLFNGAALSEEGMAKLSDGLVCKIIAICSDGVGQEDLIKKLPTAVKLNALLEIWRLSVPDVKKLIELLYEATAALKGSNAVLPLDLKAPSKS